MKTKTIITICLLFALAACAPAQIEPIKIGYFGPATGPVSYSGAPIKEAFELAFSQMPEANGRPIQVIFEDDKCDPKEAVTVATKLLDVDNVDILVSGVCSGSTLAVAPIAQERKAILISPAAASPKITTAGDFVFRLASSSELMAAETVKAMQKLGIKKVAVLYENNAYTAGWNDAFAKHFADIGTVVASEMYDGPTSDVRTSLTKFEQASPDAILLLPLAAPSANNLLKQYKELGLKTQLIGSEAMGFKAVLPNEPEGMLVLTYDFDLNSPEMQKMLSGYQSKFGKNVTEEIYGALGYDTYNVLQTAINACGDDTECIKQKLNNLGTVTGASGTFHLDENGDAIHSFVLRKAQNSKLASID